jgi:hypothetical protein
MNGSSHVFKISADELAYLRDLLSNHDELSEMLASLEAHEHQLPALRLDREKAEQLRSFLTEQLAKIGFQEDYSLTERGKILEELIDRFYLP